MDRFCIYKTPSQTFGSSLRRSVFSYTVKFEKSAFARLDIRLQARDEVREGLNTLLTGEGAHGNRVAFRFLIAEDEHIRDLLALCLADLVADLLVAQIGLDAQASLLQTVGNVLGVVVRAVSDGHDLDLHGREPQRERAGIVLGEDADEALDGAEADAVDHDRAVLLAVGADILEVKALGHLHVELDGTALPGAAEAVFQMEVDLRAVERAVALVDDIGLAELVERGDKAVGRDFPLLVRADMVLRHGGQLHMVLEAEERVHIVNELGHALDLVLDLIGRHEDVRIVLREAADAEQAVQRAGQLVAVHDAEFADTQRQVTVGVRLGLIDQHAAGAVHRFERERHIVDDGRVHVVFVVIPVTAAVPEVLVEHDRCRDLDIAGLLMDLAPVVDELVFEHHAIGQEEREARALVHEREQAELLAELPVVALFGLFDTGQIRIELLLLREAGAVDALKHLAVAVAAPVGAGDARQLDGVALDAAGGVQMRAGAEVNEFALAVEGDNGVFRQVVDELDLVRLIALLHELQRFVAGELKALETQLFLADLAHLGLKLLEHLGRERLGAVKIVIETVLDGRADGQLHLGVQALHGLGENVAGGVTVGILVGLVFKGVLIVHNVSS